MTYSPERDREAMYAFVTPLLREHRIRCGDIQPATEEERAWAAEGPKSWREYAAAGRCA